ncbi:MAG TPA: tyrosine--tRNA ligase [Candidatus Saccharimonadales bacterium]|nr:tyrosine--tRNA ligase [Candidatus Saccharimonadales bacterium]
MAMTLSEELKWRGFVNQTTYKDLSEIDHKPPKFYHGYDGSADSLTIGNLAAVMMDRCFIRHGAQAFGLAGGATSLVGDPGGKDSERELKSEAEVRANVAKIHKQLAHLLGPKAKMVNNLDWFRDMNVLHFLRDVGKHFSITNLIQKDFIATRIGKEGSGISYAEFSYSLLQGYDFLYLFKTYGVSLQLAGSDQWGNSLSGVDLIRRVENKIVNVLTCPLIINASTGVKFGKSEQGAVWLDPEKTPVLQFYQIWINLDDKGIDSYLKVFTELSKAEIDEVVKKHNENPARRHGQHTLARLVTELVHGEKQAELAVSQTEQLKGSAVVDAPSDVMSIKLPSLIVDVMVDAKLSSSKSEARRLLGSGAVYLNDTVTEKDSLSESDFRGGFLRLRKGKSIANSVLLRLDS